MLPRGVLLACVLSLGCTLAIACDEEPTSGAAASAAPSATPPTPEKIAGVEGGAIRVCIVAPDAPGDTMTVHAGSSIGVGIEQPELVLKKGEKGFCEYTKPNLAWTTGNYFRVLPPDGVKLTEVGLYFLKDWKENPAFGDLTYVKAGRVNDNPTYFVYMTKNSTTIPKIEIQARE